MNQPPSKTAAYSRHFYSLDVLRGIAALGVVVYHWQHFFFVGTQEGNVDLNRLPLYGLFKPLYAEGWRAVDLFFCLSGFIFYWLYSEKIAMRKTSLKEFAVLRFSRLYPLHFLTLLLVAAGQLIMLKCYGSYFVYPNNDLYHFVLQLFFMSNWGFERGLSFNGPIWSVSVEAFLYAIFFVVCILRFHRWWCLPILIWLGHFLLKYGHGELSQGMVSFFSGGLSYYLFLLFWRRGITTVTVVSLILLIIALWIIIPLTDNRSALTAVDAAGNTGEDLVVHHANLLGRILFRLHENAFEMILFPATILTLATCEAFHGTLGKRLSFLGDISYSVYVVHFPLQLLFIIVASIFSISNAVFLSPWTMLLFFAILIALSLCSYKFFERPLQKLLRSSLL